MGQLVDQPVEPSHEDTRVARPFGQLAVIRDDHGPAPLRVALGADEVDDGGVGVDASRVLHPDARGEWFDARRWWILPGGRSGAS